MKKKLFCLLLSVFVILSICVPAFAHGDSSITDSNFNAEKPIRGIAPFTAKPSKFGSLSNKEIKDLQSVPEVTPRHIAIDPHSHQITQITDTYDGYIDRGEVESAYNGSGDDDVLTYSRERSISNGYHVNIGFTSSVVSAEVGYDVTWSDKETFAYSMDVPDDKTGHIGFQDWYHVKDFDCVTYYFPPVGSDYEEYGSGWSKQWWKPHFYSWITDGNTP